MKRAVIVAALVVGCTQPSGGNGTSGVDVKYGASLQVEGAQQASGEGGLMVLALVALTNRGEVPLPLSSSRFSVELPSGLAYGAEWYSSCPGEKLVSGHTVQCMLSFQVPPPGLATAILYQLPDDRVLRAPAMTRPCQTCGTSQCHDLMADEAHCGACGVAADFCESGVPGCRSGYSLCPDGCADLAFDRFNCGGCGRQCGSGQDCVGGTCVVDCHSSDPNACLTCCQALHPSGAAQYEKLYQGCLCTQPGVCAVDCGMDFCATGVFNDPFCQFCAQDSSCDPTPQCQLDADCAAYLDCAQRSCS